VILGLRERRQRPVVCSLGAAGIEMKEWHTQHTPITAAQPAPDILSARVLAVTILAMTITAGTSVPQR